MTMINENTMEVMEPVVAEVAQEVVENGGFEGLKTLGFVALGAAAVGAVGFGIYKGVKAIKNRKAKKAEEAEVEVSVDEEVDGEETK